MTATISVAEAARQLQVTKEHIRRLIRERQISSTVSPERRHDVDADSVALYKQQRESKAAAGE